MRVFVSLKPDIHIASDSAFHPIHEAKESQMGIPGLNLKLGRIAERFYKFEDLGAGLKVEFMAGTSLTEAAKDLAAAAKASNQVVHGDFNGTKLTAKPGDAPETVAAPYRKILADAQAKAEAAAAAAATKREQAVQAYVKGGGKLNSRPPADLLFDPRGTIKPGSLFNSSNDTLYLLKPAQIESLPKGTVLTSISGEQKIKGIDYIDDDTRGGFTAYGFLHRDRFGASELR